MGVIVTVTVIVTADRAIAAQGHDCAFEVPQVLPDIRGAASCAGSHNLPGVTTDLRQRCCCSSGMPPLATDQFGSV